MPATGSSTSSSFGSCASSMPISSHCFWPCDRPPATRDRACVEPDDVEHRVDAFSCSAEVCPEQSRARRCGRSSARAAGCPRPCASRTRSASGICGRCRASAISVSSSLVRSYLAALEEDVAVVRPRLAGDDVHHRRLAGAVRADDGAHLARLDHERQLVERLEAVERDADAVEIEQRGGGCSDRSCSSLRCLRGSSVRLAMRVLFALRGSARQ